MSVRRARAGLLVAVLLLVASCVHYPSVEDVGGTRLRPENGHAVRTNDGAAVYFDLASTGKYGDRLLAVSAPVAREAHVVDAAGAPLRALDVPGVATVRFAADGPHVVLSGLTRPLVPGETIIVTLTFQKSGGVGVIALVQ